MYIYYQVLHLSQQNYRKISYNFQDNILWFEEKWNREKISKRNFKAFQIEKGISSISRFLLFSRSLFRFSRFSPYIYFFNFIFSRFLRIAIYTCAFVWLSMSIFRGKKILIKNTNCQTGKTRLDTTHNASSGSLFVRKLWAYNNLPAIIVWQHLYKYNYNIYKC